MQTGPKKPHVSPFRQNFNDLNEDNFKDDPKLWALLQWKNRMRTDVANKHTFKKQKSHSKLKPAAQEILLLERKKPDPFSLIEDPSLPEWQRPSPFSPIEIKTPEPECEKSDPLSPLASIATCLINFSSPASFFPSIISLFFVTFFDPVFGEETIYQLRLSFVFVILLQMSVFLVTIFAVSKWTTDDGLRLIVPEDKFTSAFAGLFLSIVFYFFLELIRLFEWSFSYHHMKKSFRSSDFDGYDDK